MRSFVVLALAPLLLRTFQIVACATVVLFGLSLEAKATSITPSDLSAASSIGNTSVDHNTGTTSGSTSFSNSTASTSGIISSLPSPNMTATAQESGASTARVVLLMHYFFEFQGSITEELPSQPIFFASGGITGSPTVFSTVNAGMSRSLAAALAGEGAPIGYSLGDICVQGLAGCATGSSFTQTTQPSVAAGLGMVWTNVIYVIAMNVDITASQGETITAFLDPMITFDQSLDNGITLLLSPDVGNDPLTIPTTPLPAALPLFAAGLGALGLLTRRRKRALVAACALALSVGAANASTVTFDVNGSFAAVPGSTLSGTINVDVTGGTITAADLLVSGFLPFNVFVSAAFTPFPGLALVLSDAESPAKVLEVDFSNSGFTLTSLVGFNGGPIVGGQLIHGDLLQCDVTGILCYEFLQGSITPEVANTPLPATFPLFATGLGALGLLGWRRRRMRAAALAA